MSEWTEERIAEGERICAAPVDLMTQVPYRGENGLATVTTEFVVFARRALPSALAELRRLQAANKRMNDFMQMAANSVSEYEVDLRNRRDGPSAMNDCIERIVTTLAAWGAAKEPTPTPIEQYRRCFEECGIELPGYHREVAPPDRCCLRGPSGTCCCDHALCVCRCAAEDWLRSAAPDGQHPSPYRRLCDALSAAGDPHGGLIRACYAVAGKDTW